MTDAPQKKHTKIVPAILGVIFSVFALILVGIASLFTREPVIKSGSTASEAAVTKAVGGAVGGILSMPLVIGAFTFAYIAIVLAVVAFRARIITCAMTLILSGWAITVAVHVFRHIAGK